MRVAIVHDYLTQRGGAERVVLSMVKAFPGAPVYTALYEPDGTFPEFQNVDVRVSRLNAVGAFRRDPRRALAFLAPAFSNMRVDADVALCSSSGWAHGCRTSGRKLVYCHNPARWLYQPGDYLGEHSSATARLGLAMLRRSLLRWDKAAAATADQYLTQSRAVQSRIATAYGRMADLLPAPASLDVAGQRTSIPQAAPEFFICVSRLLPYKHVQAVMEAFRSLDVQLLVVGDGPERPHLERLRPPNVALLGTVSDAELRWLYANCTGVVAAAYEDYGLTPLEALLFGRPSAVLRYGGFLDTVIENGTGVYFERPEPAEIARAVTEVRRTTWRPEVLDAAAVKFREETFIARLQEIVAALGASA